MATAAPGGAHAMILAAQAAQQQVSRRQQEEVRKKKEQERNERREIAHDEVVNAAAVSVGMLYIFMAKSMWMQQRACKHDEASCDAWAVRPCWAESISFVMACRGLTMMMRVLKSTQPTGIWD